MIDWSLDLNELPIKVLPEESKRLFVDGNRFQGHACDHDFTYKLRTGHDQLAFAKAALQRAQRKKGPTDRERTLLGVASRIVEVDGVDNILEWLEDQDLLDLRELIREMDSNDCGIETSIEVVCSGPNGCGLQQEVELPLDGRFFAMEM